MSVSREIAAGLLFNEQLLARISANLQGFEPRRHHGGATRRAAVALTVVEAGGEAPGYGIARRAAGEAALILTRRSERLDNHAGQWAFPGGSLEEGESAEEAALRELGEEVGLRLEQSSILGRLDDFTTRSGFTITPVVCWAEGAHRLVANPDEVGSIHRIPLDEFLREDAPLLQTIPESDRPVLLMPVGGGWIATPTGAIIFQFREVALLGRSIRVDHYEQPYFAWR